MINPDAQISIQIRPMTATDLEEVLQIDRASFTLPWPASAYRHEIENNQLSLCYVAETTTVEQSAPNLAQQAESKPIVGRKIVDRPIVDRQVVGLIVVWLIMDEAHIATIATHPDFRQRGIARRLLAESLRHSQQRQATSATLEVRASNLAAQELYARFGFEVVGRRRRYYRDNQEDALLMTLHDLDEDYLHWLAENLENAPEN